PLPFLLPAPPPPSLSSSPPPPLSPPLLPLYSPPVRPLRPSRLCGVRPQAQHRIWAQDNGSGARDAAGCDPRFGSGDVLAGLLPVVPP
ncbi:unnamed protein product, partial [Urochloa humidicola]